MGKTVNTYVHLTDPETGETFVLKPGDEVPSEYKGLVGDHVYDEGDVLDSEIDLVAGPSQGLADADQDALEKARKAEASRRSRAAKKAAASDKDEPVETEKVEA